MDKSWLERVRAASDIVSVVTEHVRLEGRGKRLWGLCPFHAEKTPSFSVDAERQTYKCFGCGKGGDVFTFVMEKKGLSFAEAAGELAGRAGIEIAPVRGARRSENKALYDANAFAMEFFEGRLASPEGGAARRYLEARGIGGRTIERFRIGFAPDSWDALSNHLRSKGVGAAVAEKSGLVSRKRGGGHYDRFRNRIVFPIFDLSGEVVAFGGRVMDSGEPKYLNTAETPIFEKRRVLYNLHAARGAIRKEGAVVVEGYMDVVSLAEAGFPSAVATLGTAMGEDHVRLLRRFTDDVTLVFDGDEAGRRAMVKAFEPFAASGMMPRVVLLPGGKDPDDVAREGIEVFMGLLAGARDIWELMFDESFSRHDPSKLRGQNAILKELTSMIAQFGDAALRDLLSQRLASRLGVSPGVVRRALAPAGAARDVQPAGEGAGSTERGLLESTLLRLLVQDRSAAERVISSGTFVAFADRDLQELFDYLVSNGPASIDESSCPDSVRMTASRLAAQGRFQGDTKKALIDTVYRFKSLALDDELKRIQAELVKAEEGRDRDRRNELLRTMQDAMRARKGLRERIMEEFGER